jgi:hypothetical protein
MSEVSTGWQRVVATLAGLGFVLSVLWHVAAQAGIALEMPPYAFVLFAGVFIVWFPTVLYLQRFNKELHGSFGLGGWKYVVTGAPPWLVALALLASVYAILNFLLVVPMRGGARVENSGVLFSGHAMAFYAVAALVNWAAVQREEQGIEWSCVRGHRLSPSEKFCPRMRRAGEEGSRVMSR